MRRPGEQDSGALPVLSLDARLYIEKFAGTLAVRHHNSSLSSMSLFSTACLVSIGSNMMLQDIGARIKRAFAPSAERTAEKKEKSASTTRQDRAGTIDRLQNEVHRLQHEIADLSVRSESGSPDVDKTATDKQIDALQKELEQTQQSLAKLQGRV
jgi:peptidoglycan hydrolase CwlO-like protein